MPSREQLLLILIPFAYLIGSIPFGLLVGQAKGIDPRTSGSGNIGASNLGRLLGNKYFWIVFTLDFLKGCVPAFAASAILGFAVTDWQECFLWIVVAAVAVFGHMFSIFLKFKGGKGVATSAGVLIGIFPYYTIAGLIAVATFLLIFKTTRYISLGSMLGSSAFPIAYAAIGLARGWPILSAQFPFLFFGMLFPTLIIIKHRPNIARLRAGTEPKYERKRPTPDRSKQESEPQMHVVHTDKPAQVTNDK
jgi:glycerol-3-phosphate acyltransferase PlsY